MNDFSKSYWEVTYRQTIAKMIGVCYRYTYDRQVAEDLAHDAFLIAIDKSASFENKGPIEAWLRRIAVNVVLQYLREQKRRKHHEHNLAADRNQLEFSDESQRNEEISFSEAELLDAIKLLPEHHRLVFNMHVIDRLTHAQIGAELNISEGTSKSHLARARKKIIETLTGNTKASKKRRRLPLLLLLRDWIWDVDSLIINRFYDFQIPPQKQFQIDTVKTSGNLISTPESSLFLHKTHIYAEITYVVVAVNFAILLLVYGSNQKFQAPLEGSTHGIHKSRLPELNTKVNDNKKLLNRKTSSATFSENGIISSKKTKLNNDMKYKKNLSALLLAGSTVAFTPPALMNNYQIPITLTNRQNVDIPESLQTIKLPDSNMKKDSIQGSGTFYASKLSWSAKNNGLYLSGKQVRVNFNENNFNGSGGFSFLPNIDYLVFNGTPMKLNETVLLSDKKYRLTQLTEEHASRKYGKKGNVVVEVNVDE